MNVVKNISILKCFRNPQKVLRCISLICIILTTLSVLYLLLSNHRYPSGYISDIHQYVQDAQGYINLTLPGKSNGIHASPAYPLLIAITSIIFNSGSPTIHIAVFLNSIITALIILATGILGFKLDKTGILGVLFTWVTALEPLFVMGGIDGSTEPLLHLAILIILYTFLSKKYELSLWIGVIITFIRPDGIAVFLPVSCLVLYHRIQLTSSIKTFITKNKNIFYPFIVLIAFHTTIFLYNISLGFYLGSYYFHEIEQSLQQGNNLLNTRFLFNFASIFRFCQINTCFFFSQYLNQIVTVLMIMYLLYLSFRKFKQNKFQWISATFILLFLAIHSLFPAFNKRYYYSISILFFIVMIDHFYFWSKINVYKALFVVLIFLIAILKTPQYNSLSAKEVIFWKNEHNEEKAIRDWIQNQLTWRALEEKKELIIVNDSNTIKDYLPSNDHHLYFISMEYIFSECESIACTKKALEPFDSVYVIKNSTFFKPTNINQSGRVIFYAWFDNTKKEKIFSYSDPQTNIQFDIIQMKSKTNR